MRPRQMPQQVLSRFLDLSDKVEALEQEALKAESEVARLRSLLKSGNANPTTLEEANAAAANFDNVYADAQLRRSRASAQSRLLATVKAWIEGLPPNTRLTLVHAEIGTASLAQVRGELAALRSDLSKLRGNPPASLDIGRRIDDLVAEWARKATPEVRGFHNGGTLDVLWNGNRDECNGLTLMAALFPRELSEHIIGAVTRAQPLSAQQHSEKMLQLNETINRLSYVEAALVERGGGEHSIESAPWCLLGVRIERQENAAA
jgi:hypothetical protein